MLDETFDEVQELKLWSQMNTVPFKAPIYTSPLEAMSMAHVFLIVEESVQFVKLR